MVIKRSMHDVYPFIHPDEGLSGSMLGKTILITGAGSGVGRQIAIDAAIAGAAAVYVTGRDQERLDETVAAVKARSPASKAIGIKGNILSESDVKAIFARIEAPLDVLVNNVGANICNGPIGNDNADDWWNGIEVNLRSVYLTSAEFVRRANGRGGSIVNVSTSVSVGAANGGISSYSCAKAAVNRFTQWLHAEYSQHGIQAVAVHPGGMADTGMGQNAPAAYRALLYDTVALASGTILYLATERARFLSGRFVYSNWDMEAIENSKEEIVGKDLLTINVNLGDLFEAAIVPPEKSRG